VPTHTGDELAVLLRSLLDLSSLDGIVLCSSVPALVREYQAFADRWAGADLLVLGPGVPTGVPIRYDDPREVGPDRIANAVAARERHGMPCIVVDFGTSTSSRPQASSRVASSRPGSRSPWTRSSRAPRACPRCRSSRPSV
jgi:type III pantothenate kinase